jgi:hypothetical protein
VVEPGMLAEKLKNLPKCPFLSISWFKLIETHDAQELFMLRRMHDNTSSYLKESE